MGFLDGVLGGVVGAGMASVVNSVLEKHGGLPGVVSEFERNGLGATVKSWVSTGPNLPVSAEQIHQVLGNDLLQQIAAKVGIGVPELEQQLAKVLPVAVDKMTPAGVVPQV